jgi:hypothetical protein
MNGWWLARRKVAEAADTDNPTHRGGNARVFHGSFTDWTKSVNPALTMSGKERDGDHRPSQRDSSNAGSTATFPTTAGGA